MARIVLSVLTADRVGVVKELADVALAHEANWLESRMVRLAGQFAGLVLLEAPDEKVDGLVAAARVFGGEAGQVLIQQGTADDESGEAQHIELHLDGADHPGIIHQLSEALASRGINILELETDQHAASMSGHPIFTAQLHLLLPDGQDAGELAEAMESLANELMVDIRLG